MTSFYKMFISLLRVHSEFSAMPSINYAAHGAQPQKMAASPSCERHHL